MNKRIKKLRRELDLTQEKFGARIGVKGNTVAQWESGRNEPPDSSLAFICREFGVMNGFVLEQVLCMLQSQQQSWMRSRRNLI